MVVNPLQLGGTLEFNFVSGIEKKGSNLFTKGFGFVTHRVLRHNPYYECSTICVRVALIYLAAFNEPNIRIYFLLKEKHVQFIELIISSPFKVICYQ